MRALCAFLVTFLIARGYTYSASVLALMAVGEPFWRAVVREIWPGSESSASR
jgi:hypothetical protein